MTTYHIEYPSLHRLHDYPDNKETAIYCLINMKQNLLKEISKIDEQLSKYQ